MTLLQKKLIKSVSLFSIFLLSLFFYSCSQSNLDPAISPAFQHVLTRALQMHDSGDIVQSIHYIDSAANAMEPLSLRDRNEQYVFKFNIYMHDIQDFNKALAYTDSMMWLIEKSGEKDRLKKLYAEAEYRKGDALFEKQQYNGAYKYFYQAKMLQEKTDTCILSNYNYRLGMIMYKQQHFDDALLYFKDAFAQADKCGFTFEIYYRMQELLDNIALSYYNEGKKDSAVIYYNQALDFINKHENTFPDKSHMPFEKARAIVYGNLASVYALEGKNAEAEGLLKKSIAISCRKGYDIIDGQLTRIKLTRLYLDEHNYDAAYAVLQDIRSTSDSVPNRSVKVGWANLMWQYYNHKAQPQAAFDYLLIYDNLKDSLNNETTQLRGIDIRGRIKNWDTQHEIDLLEKKGERRKYLLALTITVSAMSIIILILILQNLKKSKKNIHILTTLNSHIRDQNHRLEEVLSQLEMSSKEKDRILRTVAHDIRNPIAAISTISGVLLEDTGNYTSKQKEYIRLIETACNNALQLSNEILEATNIIRKEKLSKETFDINTLLVSCVDLSRFRAVEKNQLLTISVENELGTISADREKISRAISNLLVNAIKFSPEETEIKLVAAREDSFLFISVIDHGIGIPDDIKDKVFDMFSEAKRPGTAGEKPFGLGLSITKQVIQAHGGKLWFEENPDGGTIFHVELPL